MRSHVVLINLCGVTLLVLAVVGIFLVPRVNYDVFFSTQEKMRLQVAELQKTTDDYAGTVKHLTAAFPTKAEEITESFALLSETVALWGTKLALIEERVHVLEQLVLESESNQEGPSLTYDKLADFFQHRYTDAITLPRELEKKVANSPDPQVFLQNTFDQFLEFMLNSGVLPFPSVSDIPEDIAQNIYVTFSVFKANMLLISRNESINVESLIATANEVGEYIETPANERLKRPRGQPEGITARRRQVNGMARYYHFSYDKYPHLLEAFTQRDNAKSHLFRDVYLVSEPYRSR